MKNFPKFLTVEKSIVKEFMQKYPRYTPFISIKGEEDFIVFKITCGNKIKITNEGICYLGVDLFEDLDSKLKESFFKKGLTLKERVNTLIESLVK